MNRRHGKTMCSMPAFARKKPMHPVQPSKDRPGRQGMPVAARLYGAYAWLVFAVALLTAGTAVTALRRPARSRRAARAGCRLLFRLLGMPLSVRGLERLPAGPHLLLVNHSSFLDGLALTAMLPARPGYAFVVRQQFPVQRLLCPLLRSLGTVVLAPASAGSHVGNAARIVHALRRGDSLVVFPEAGFVPEPGLRRLHSGAFAAAARTGAPVVIAGLRGARDALRPRGWLPRRAALSLEIGPVLRLADADIGPAMRAARQAMLALTGEPDMAGCPQRGAAGPRRGFRPA
jgi:1-acyl-sn-glycerol-3-phosphate acyltransferase